MPPQNFGSAYFDGIESFDYLPVHFIIGKETFPVSMEYIRYFVFGSQLLLFVKCVEWAVGICFANLCHMQIHHRGLNI